MENKLIPCPVCNHNVSSEAMKCPNCGESLSFSQKHIDQAAYIAAKSFNDMPLVVVKTFLWIVSLVVWVSVAVYIPKTLSILTVLSCIGYVSEAKKTGAVKSVKWGRVILSIILSVTFFMASFQ